MYALLLACIFTRFCWFGICSNLFVQALRAEYLRFAATLERLVTSVEAAMGINCGGSSSCLSEITCAGTEADICPALLTSRPSVEQATSLSIGSPISSGIASRAVEAGEGPEGTDKIGFENGNGPSRLSVGSPVQRPHRLKSKLTLPGIGLPTTQWLCSCSTLQQPHTGSHDRSVTAKFISGCTNPSNYGLGSDNGAGIGVLGSQGAANCVHGSGKSSLAAPGSMSTA